MVNSRYRSTGLEGKVRKCLELKKFRLDWDTLLNSILILIVLSLITMGIALVILRRAVGPTLSTVACIPGYGYRGESIEILLSEIVPDLQKIDIERRQFRNSRPEDIAEVYYYSTDVQSLRSKCLFPGFSILRQGYTNPSLSYYEVDPALYCLRFTLRKPAKSNWPSKLSAMDQSSKVKWSVEPSPQRNLECRLTRNTYSNLWRVYEPTSTTSKVTPMEYPRPSGLNWIVIRNTDRRRDNGIVGCTFSGNPLVTGFYPRLNSHDFVAVAGYLKSDKLDEIVASVELRTGKAVPLRRSTHPSGLEDIVWEIKMPVDPREKSLH